MAAGILEKSQPRPGSHSASIPARPRHYMRYRRVPRGRPGTRPVAGQATERIRRSALTRGSRSSTGGDGGMAGSGSVGLWSNFSPWSRRRWSAVVSLAIADSNVVSLCCVHRLTVERRGMRTFVVLRQYPGGLGLQGELGEEIANLGVVAGVGSRFGILATDVAGRFNGARAIVADDTVAGACSHPAEPRVDDEDRGDCCIRCISSISREMSTLDGFLDRSSRRVSGAGRRTEAGGVAGGDWCHGGAAAEGHCRLLPLRSPACQHAVAARAGGLLG